MSCQDQLLRFTFDNLDMRGELVYLDQSWQEMLARYDYPENVRLQLGEALAAIALLRATLKFEGSMILQVRGDGPLHSLVTQISSTGAIRGLARWEGLVPDANLQKIFGNAQIVITVINKNGERYQSIVALEGNSLAEALNAYFMQSEQLPSSFRLYVSAKRVAGFFLQALPPIDSSAGNDRDSIGRVERGEDWQRMNILADTLRHDEILRDDPMHLLHKLFHEEQVKLYEPADLYFECSCSREKIEGTLVSLGKEELDSIIRDEGSIKVDCEFCSQQYTFDAAAVSNLVSDTLQAPRNTTLH